jgi:hypothetical protein
MIEELPQGIRDTLTSGEQVLRVLKTYTLVNKPEYTLLTDRRILYFNEKFFGRYDLSDIPYSKLESISAERGRMRFSSIEFQKESEEKPLLLSKVPKEDIEPFIEALELAINNIAVEPISIQRRKGLMGKMEWKFKKGTEMLFKARSADAGALERKDFIKEDVSNDPLRTLKMRFVKGEISEEEYLRMKDLLS